MQRKKNKQNKKKKKGKEYLTIHVLTIKHFWIPSQLCTNIERRHINFRVVITARTGVARLYVILLCILVGSRISIRHLRFSHVICTWNAHLLSRYPRLTPFPFARIEPATTSFSFWNNISREMPRTKGAYGTFRTHVEFISGFSPPTLEYRVPDANVQKTNFALYFLS